MSPRAVLSIDRSAAILSVPGLSGRSISVDNEEVRNYFVCDDFAENFRQFHDQLHSSIEDDLDRSISTLSADTDKTVPLVIENEKFPPILIMVITLVYSLSFSILSRFFGPYMTPFILVLSQQSIAPVTMS